MRRIGVYCVVCNNNLWVKPLSNIIIPSIASLTGEINCKNLLTHTTDCFEMTPGKNIHGGSGWFRPRNAKRALENQKRPPENCHRLQCKSLFNVANLVNGMWKVAPKIKIQFFPGWQTIAKFLIYSWDQQTMFPKEGNYFSWMSTIPHFNSRGKKSLLTHSERRPKIFIPKRK